MRKIKRTLALLLAVAMMLSITGVMVFAEGEDAAQPTTAPVSDSANDSDTQDIINEPISEEAQASLPDDSVTYAKDYRFVNALGIFEMLPDEYWKTETVTRADFATVVAKMIKAQTSGYPVYDNSPFTDINASNSAYPAICYLTDIGIINGDGTGEFRPNDGVTQVEATKMIMCALGYKTAAEAEGGYPTGYIKFAQKAGIYSNITLDQGATMSALFMSKLVRNALNADMMDDYIYSTTGPTYVYSDKTLLEETYKMVESTGILEATYYGYVAGDEVDQKNLVRIGAETYQVSDTAVVEPYIGYKVNFFYVDDKDVYSRPFISYMEAKDNDNTVIELGYEDIVSISNTQIEYSDPNTGRNKTMTVSPKTTSVSYNGKPYTIPENGLTLTEGGITLISHGSTAMADVVIIKQYVDGVFERLSNKDDQVIFQGGSSFTNSDGVKLTLPDLYVDEDSVNYRTRLIMDGKVMKAGDLQKNDVITYMSSASESDSDTATVYITGYVSRETVADTITESRTEKTPSGLTYKVVKMSGEEYKVSTYCRITSSIKAGYSADFAITFDGRIVDKVTGNANSSNYAYLIGCDVGNDPLSQYFTFKIFTLDGKVEKLYSNTRIKTNIMSETKTRSVADIIKQGFATAYTEAVGDLIMYDVDSDNKVKTIYLAQNYTSTYTPTDDLDFGKYYTGSSARYQNGLIANCAITDDTVVFQVPFTDRGRDTDYKTVKPSELSNGAYSVDIYDIKNGVAGALVIKDKESSKISDTANIMVVDELVTAYDTETQEEVKRLSGFVNGEMTTLTIDEDATMSSTDSIGFSKDIETLSRGDVLQYTLGANGYISIYRILFDRSTCKTIDYYQYNQDGASVYKVANDDLFFTYSKVQKAYDFFMIATSSSERKYSRAYPLTGSYIYEYDEKKNELTLGDVYDIEEGDPVFIRAKNIDDQVDILVLKLED